MSRDSIKTLTELALAQAQECFLEKVTVVEKKKGNLASKLCAQLSFMYMTVLDGFSLESISRQFEKTWLELIRVCFYGLKQRSKPNYLQVLPTIIDIYNMKWIINMVFLLVI